MRGRLDEVKGAGTHETVSVFTGTTGTGEQIHDLAHPGSAVALIFVARIDLKSLTAVFLVDAVHLTPGTVDGKHPAAGKAATVVTFDHDDGDVTEDLDPAFRGGVSEARREPHAKHLVLYLSSKAGDGRL